MNMICSNYHIELSPGDAGINDKFVVQEVIKEMAANRSLNAGTGSILGASESTSASTNAGANATEEKEKVQYKIVVLVEVDKLTRQAQAALRRTMEKYSSSCRLILVCNNQSKVMDALRSRCLGIRIPAPSVNDICTSLKYVAEKEKVTLSEELCISIARNCNRNARRAILMLETSRINAGSSNLSSKLEKGVQKTDWELYIAQLAVDITKEQSPQMLLSAREKLYELLINCIPPSIIIKNLAMELMKNLDDELKHDVLEAAAFYEHRIALGSKDIFHLEAFVAKFMAVYKQYLLDMFA